MRAGGAKKNAGRAEDWRAMRGYARAQKCEKRDAAQYYDVYAHAPSGRSKYDALALPFPRRQFLAFELRRTGHGAMMRDEDTRQRRYDVLGRAYMPASAKWQKWAMRAAAVQ